MIEKLKNIGYSVLGIGFFILFIIAITLLIIGGVKLFETLYTILEGIGTVTWGIVWVLLLLSIVPRFRNFTGSGIILGTYVGGAIFWLLCFYVTFQLWGLLGIFVGVLFFGLGVFFTALLALLFDGQFMGALGFAFVLAQIFFFRFLGYWIISKYKGVQEVYTSGTPELGESEMETINSYCGKCGNRLDLDSKFCAKCGAEIKTI